jgi:hypothetical protein
VLIKMPVTRRVPVHGTEAPATAAAAAAAAAAAECLAKVNSSIPAPTPAPAAAVSCRARRRRLHGVEQAHFAAPRLQVLDAVVAAANFIAHRLCGVVRPCRPCVVTPHAFEIE